MVSFGGVLRTLAESYAIKLKRFRSTREVRVDSKRLAVVGTSVALLLAVIALPAHATTLTPTADAAPCTITGTSGGDRLVGTRGSDVICGLGGNDIIRAGLGNDIIRGGNGTDSIDEDGTPRKR